MSIPMNQQADDLEALNNLYVIQSLLQGMNLNIQLIERGAIGKIIPVSNANLFQIAAQEYGDATQWTTIANANGLSDPMIETTITADVDGNTITFNGIPASPQTISFGIQGVLYTYNVAVNDTLDSIARNIALLVRNSTSEGNIVTFFPGALVTPVEIQRVVNLVIPQQTGLPSGGIL